MLRQHLLDFVVGGRICQIEPQVTIRIYWILTFRHFAEHVSFVISLLLLRLCKLFLKGYLVLVECSFFEILFAHHLSLLYFFVKLVFTFDL